MRMFIFLLLSAFTAHVGQAATVTATFDGSPSVAEEGGFLLWAEAGIDFAAANGSYAATQVGGGSIRWLGPSPTPILTFSMSDGSRFSLVQLSLFEHAFEFGECCWPVATADIVGYRADGSTVSIINIDSSSADGLVSFDSAWTDLTYVAIVDRDIGADPSNAVVLNVNSVTVAVVPVPAALWLFGSGLAGLGWRMRRRRSSAHFSD